MTRRACALLLAGMICMGAIYAIPNQQAFAHIFSGDESASFLALVESIKVELDLVQSNLASNVTLAEEHAEHAHGHLDEHIIEEISERNERLGRDLPAALEDLHDSVVNSTAQQVQTKIQIINDLLGDTVTVRVDSDQLSNSTVWALVIANMADGVVGHYGAAYGIETEEGEEHGTHGHDEEGNTTHDDMEMTETSSEENMTHDEMEDGSRGNTSGGNATTIVDVGHYQSAQGLAARTQALFSDQVKELAPAESAAAVADLEAGLAHLKQAIDDKEPFVDVETILHSEVHHNLRIAFNLQLADQEPADESFTASYTLNGETYTVNGKSTAKATSMSINPNTSVVVQFDQPAEVELTLPKNMIDGITTVMAGDHELEFDVVNTTDSSTTIRFTLPEESDSVEIMGATVVPEFATIAALVLAVSLIATIAFARMKHGNVLQPFRNP